MPRLLTGITLLGLFASTAWAASDKDAAQVADGPAPEQARAVVEQLQEPLYNPFVERYVLDELKALRTQMADQRAEMIQQVVDREHSAVDRAVTYATDTITYFFYVIAAASSVLVLVGWSSIRDIKERLHSVAEEEISRLVREYEARLASIEEQLNLKSRHIEENREAIDATNEVQSLWLRAGQEPNPANKIALYDQIMRIRPYDPEALTYKADAVLELGEAQWATNLCHQALRHDPDNSHAFFQLACAAATLGHFEDAVRYLEETIQRSDTYRLDIMEEPTLDPLKDFPPFRALMGLDPEAGE